MPQPALHLLVAETTLQHWRARPDRAPFDCADDNCVNAFRHGCLAPDYGLFPGGDAGLADIMHHGRTGLLLRTTLHAARSPAQRAFACGWLTHTIADVAIHPIINAAADARYGCRTLANHIRVEVGIDVWFAWQHVGLRALRLTPAFPRADYAFVREALLRTHAYPVSAGQLVRMQRGMIHFTHAALHFATSLARHVCWDRTSTAVLRYPASAMLWRVLSSASSRSSLIHAYLNPTRPDPSLVTRVGSALTGITTTVDEHIATDLLHLPDYDLETGAISATDNLSVA